MPGQFIVIEGPDGAGKTTLIGGLTRRLADGGVICRLLREPGATVLGERLRALLKGHDGDVPIGPRAEALLFAAARAQLIDDVVRPAIAAGEWVVADRFVDSSVAYQGFGRGLGEQPVRDINQFATGGVTADLTLVLTLSDDEAARRRRTRDGDGQDRFEAAGAEFRRLVQAGYDRALISNPSARAVDADGTPGQVLDRAWRHVSDLLD